MGCAEGRTELEVVVAGVGTRTEVEPGGGVGNEATLLTGGDTAVLEAVRLTVGESAARQARECCDYCLLLLLLLRGGGGGGRGGGSGGGGGGGRGAGAGAAAGERARGAGGRSAICRGVKAPARPPAVQTVPIAA